MIAIANNISTRSRRVAEALKHRPAESISGKAAEAIHRQRTAFLQDLAKRCVDAGANVLEVNLQQKHDRPEVMKLAVETVQDAVDCQICLSADSIKTMEAGLEASRKPPIVNYLSLHKDRLESSLRLAASYGADVILLLADPLPPTDPGDVLKAAGVLVGAANESGIPNERIILDPGVLHITSDIGQRYAEKLPELILALSEEFEPAVRTTCWVNNVSAGIPERLRSTVNSTFLSMLAGAGLSSAFVDVLDRDMMRTVRLIRILRDHAIYSDRDAER